MPDRILVVDDELDILNLVKMILSRRGYRVVTASNGDEALRLAEAEVPDLILLDLVMPGKSGLEVCKILKTQTKTKATPIVMFTALGRDIDKKLTAEAGSDAHFTKPFTHEALLAEVKAHVEKARAEKFSKQLGIAHEGLKGKKILLEFDPATLYERLVRDFVLECAFHSEKALVLTKKGSAVRQVLEGDGDVELIDLTPETMLSPVLEKYPSSAVSLVYDSLTDLVLSRDPRMAHEFTRNALELLAAPNITALFLLNPLAHESRDVSSLRGLFSTQLAYSKQGLTNVRIT